jgi:cytochrome c5
MHFHAPVFRHRTESTARHPVGGLRRMVVPVLGGLMVLISTASAAAAVPRGQAVYEQACIACHGAGGEGALPGVPDLTGPTGPLSKPDGVLMDHMINGFQGPGSPMAMPPKGGNPSLTREDIEQVLRYMRETFGGT